MSEMLERVARAICRGGMTGPKDHLDEQENSNWRMFVVEARAAIAAMREPTNAMIVTGDEKIIWHLNGTSLVRADPTPAQNCFVSMIDEALRDDE